MKKTSFPSRRDFWRSLIQEQRRSGLSQTEFCGQRGICKSSFSNWSSRLRKEESTASFIPVKIGGEKSKSVRMIFQNGIALEFADLPDADWISQIMRISA